ncbi:hypothetical protein K3495_g10038 [Podosphaera aphanis]|nr:hypothetical protein K3495_g10038 [Podosphaera aphanis]
MRQVTPFRATSRCVACRASDKSGEANEEAPASRRYCRFMFDPWTRCIASCGKVRDHRPGACGATSRATHREPDGNASRNETFQTRNARRHHDVSDGKTAPASNNASHTPNQLVNYGEYRKKRRYEKLRLLETIGELAALLYVPSSRPNIGPSCKHIREESMVRLT